jgi:hypothetical protein
MCSPSRNSVLSGRYPFHVGFYDNNGGMQQGTPTSFSMLPDLLKSADPPYSSHALGKWHAGWVFRNHTPAWRGFDTFYGSSGNTDDYWSHESGNNCPDTNTASVAVGSDGVAADLDNTKVMGYDFIDSVAPTQLLSAHYSAGAPPLLDARMEEVWRAGAARFAEGVIRPVSEMNGTYDARALTTRAVKLVQQHDATKGPMYMYLAYHSASTADRTPHLHQLQPCPRPP